MALPVLRICRPDSVDASTRLPPLTPDRRRALGKEHRPRDHAAPPSELLVLSDSRWSAEHGRQTRARSYPEGRRAVATIRYRASRSTFRASRSVWGRFRQERAGARTLDGLPVITAEDGQADGEFQGRTSYAVRSGRPGGLRPEFAGWTYSAGQSHSRGSGRGRDKHGFPSRGARHTSAARGSR